MCMKNVEMMIIIYIIYVLLVMLTLKSASQSQKEKEQDEKALYRAVFNNNKDDVERLLAKGVSSTAYKGPVS